MKRFNRKLLSLCMNGHTDIKEMGLQARLFNEDDSQKESALQYLFYCKSINVIHVKKHKCVGKVAYESDLRSIQFSNVMRNCEAGRISAQFSNIVFGPGPQPEPKHDKHVMDYAMLALPKAYDPFFKKKPDVLIDIKDGNVLLLKEALKPLPGMCRCTERLTWTTFENISIDSISEITLIKEKEDRFRLKIHVREE